MQRALPAPDRPAARSSAGDTLAHHGSKARHQVPANAQPIAAAPDQSGDSLRRNRAIVEIVPVRDGQIRASRAAGDECRSARNEVSAASSTLLSALRFSTATREGTVRQYVATVASSMENVEFTSSPPCIIANAHAYRDHSQPRAIWLRPEPLHRVVTMHGNHQDPPGQDPTGNDLKLIDRRCAPGTSYSACVSANGKARQFGSAWHEPEASGTLPAVRPIPGQDRMREPWHVRQPILHRVPQFRSDQSAAALTKSS